MDFCYFITFFTVPSGARSTDVPQVAHKLQLLTPRAEPEAGGALPHSSGRAEGPGRLQGSLSVPTHGAHFRVHGECAPGSRNPGCVVSKQPDHSRHLCYCCVVHSVLENCFVFPKASCFCERNRKGLTEVCPINSFNPYLFTVFM